MRDNCGAAGIDRQNIADVERYGITKLLLDELAADLKEVRTVRNRVARFTEITGLDLRRTEDPVTTRWLLTHRHLARATRQVNASDGQKHDAAR